VSSGSQWWVTATHTRDAKLLFAYSQSTVPLITIITRKAYGGAFDVMASKEISADMNDPDKIAKRTREYEDRFLSPFIAAERGYFDDVIMPHSTRKRIARALAMLRDKRSRFP
jgi:propionyl-CoA carboxylase beta subunit